MFTIFCDFEELPAKNGAFLGNIVFLFFSAYINSLRQCGKSTLKVAHNTCK
jgi:hypothetical protein